MTDTQPSPAAMEAANALIRILPPLQQVMCPFNFDRTVALALDAFARDAVREAVKRCCKCICQGCAEEMPLLEPALHGRQCNEQGDIEGGPCAAIDIRRAFADVLEGRS